MCAFRCWCAWYIAYVRIQSFLCAECRLPAAACAKGRDGAAGSTAAVQRDISIVVAERPRRVLGGRPPGVMPDSSYPRLRRSAATCCSCGRRTGTGSCPLFRYMLRSTPLLCSVSQPSDRTRCRDSGRVPGGARRELPLEFIHGCQTICIAWSFEGRGRRRERPSRAGRHPRLSTKSSSPTTRAHSPTSRISRPHAMGGIK